MSQQHDIPKQILIIDDHELFRAGLRLILQAHVDAEITEVEKISDVKVLTGEIDVILLDICLPGLNGIDGMIILKNHWPQARIMLLSALSHHKDINAALASGASCFLNKNSAPNLICDTVKTLLSKRVPQQPEIEHNLTSAVSESKVLLSHRLLEVLELIGQGASNKTIADQLFLSEHTVRNHTSALMEHFNVHNRTQVILAAQRAGYLSLIK